MSAPTRLSGTVVLLHLPDGRQQVAQLTHETVALSYAQQAADCDTDADAHQVWHQARRALGLPGTTETRIAWDTYVAAAADVQHHEAWRQLDCPPCLRGRAPRARLSARPKLGSSGCTTRISGTAQAPNMVSATRSWHNR